MHGGSETTTGPIDRSARLLAPALLAAALLAACGAAAGGAGGGQPPAAVGSPAPTATARVPLRTPPTVDARTVTAGDQDNGRVLSVHVGDHLRVVLASTYWQLAGSSDPNVLRPAGEPAVSPQPSGCVPGGGCGSVTAPFDAVAAGRADVTARRASCGEALACTGAQGSYRVTVVVLG
jgi:hypothetical protein